MTRPEAVAGGSSVLGAARAASAGGRWLPPGVPPAVRLIERLGLSPGRVIACFVLAVVLHLPLMPFVRLLAFGFFDETEETDSEAIVPIDIEIEDDETPKPPAQKEEAVEITSPDETGDDTTGIADAGVDASKGIEDAGPDGSQQVDDAGIDAPPDAPPPLPQDKDPLANQKAMRDLSKNPNNVQIILVGTRLREHPVGAKLGALLPTLKQWEPFFKGSGIDPINDMDAMVITGPQIKISGDVVAIMKFNIDMEKVETTIQNLADSSGGAKLEDTPVPAWKATADKGVRIFATVPSKGLLYVMPWPKRGKKDKELSDDEWAKAEKKRVDEQLARVKIAKFPDYTKEAYAIDAYMIQPYKLVSKTGEIKLGPLEIQLIPKTLETMRLFVVPNGGDADVTLTFTAKNGDDAELAMSDLKASWPLFQIGARSEAGMDLPDLEWERKGNKIEAKATLPQASLDKVYELGKKHSEDVKSRAKN